MTTGTDVKTKWGIDATHSEVQFKVKHLVIATVTGSFKKFNGSVESESETDFEGATVEFSVDVDSIDTNQADRDKHLKSPDFFSAEEFPTIDFKGQMKKVEDKMYKLTGPLTVRGVTKDVQLNVEFGGIVKDPWGNTKAGFELNGKINRKDFGLLWNAVTETGGVVVADEVKLHLNIELIKSQE
jgi:polyisoprenoid-binding protein YceI